MNYIDCIIPIVVLILLCMFLFLGISKGYETGQVDALKGKQNYHLIEFPDGTRGFYHKKDLGSFNDENNNFKIIK
jgi:hypothetical protein